MARPEGFEPPTTWFEAKYSIQLSYGRAACPPLYCIRPARRDCSAHPGPRPCGPALRASKIAPGDFVEPPTTWFEAKYSIQLSYGRAACPPLYCIRPARRDCSAHPGPRPCGPALRASKIAPGDFVEPPTTWFEAKYSIQLSYGRAACPPLYCIRPARRDCSAHPGPRPCGPALRASKIAPGDFVEPPTTWFEARYSIQLSYGRAVLPGYFIRSPGPAAALPRRNSRPP